MVSGGDVGRVTMVPQMGAMALALGVQGIFIEVDEDPGAPPPGPSQEGGT